MVERERKPGFAGMVRHDDDSLAPPVVGADELVDRQGVEELVGDKDQRAGRHAAEIV